MAQAQQTSLSIAFDRPATGAGAQSRVAIGTAVVGGMITATVLAIFYVPLFFITIARLFGSDKEGNGTAMPPAPQAGVPA